MAEGGIVGLPQMTPIAREMAAMGRNGDTMLAHITPQEAMMLQRMGGSGTINPYTGLPEFFLKKLFRGIGKAIKSVGKAVKKFAKSTVGRIVLSVALGAFLGPMATGFLSGMGVTVGAAAATGISAGIGVFGSSLLAGDGFKNSLRNGLTAGALSFGVAGVTQRVFPRLQQMLQQILHKAMSKVLQTSRHLSKQPLTLYEVGRRLRPMFLLQG
jgi:hypothetical protein